MRRLGIIEKPPGSFFVNHGRWSWKVKLPGDDTRRTIKLCPPGQSVALRATDDNQHDAWRLAWAIWRNSTSTSYECPTVATLASRWFAEVSQRVSPSQAVSLDCGLRELVSKYGTRPADSIGIEEMRDIRESLKAKYVRETANKYIRTVQRCYAWAKDESLVDPHTAGLVCGFGLIPPGVECGGNYRDVSPVDPETVRETLPALSPTVRDMVIVQWVCDMRPGEVCKMCIADIDTTDPELWIYEPEKHKTAHKGQARFIPIFPEAWEIIERRKKHRNKTQCLFTPTESNVECRAKRTEARKTPLSCGNKPGSNRKGTQVLNDCFDSRGYARHISRAIAKINSERKSKKQKPLESWSPNQLRHTKATENRAKYGRDIAAILLGHTKDSKATDIYTRQAIKDEVREKAKRELREAVKGLE